MVTTESPTDTSATTQALFAAITAECLKHDASTNNGQAPIWHDPAWLATIDDTTLGEAD